jgi:hypothetical protein
VLFERWYNVAMFFSVISTFIATSPCFSASFQRRYVFQ